MADRDSVRDRLRKSRAQHQERHALISDGRGPAWVQDALAVALDTVGDDPSDRARRYAITLLCDEWGRIEGDDQTPDVTAIGEQVGQKVRDAEEARRSGRAGWLLRSGRRAGPPSFDALRPRVELARAPLPDVRKIEPSPIREWMEASATRSDEQAALLERLVDVAERQDRQSGVLLATAVVSAAAAVTAAAPVVIDVIRDLL